MNIYNINFTLSQDHKRAKNIRRNFAVNSKSCQLALIYQEYVGPVSETNARISSTMAGDCRNWCCWQSAIVGVLRTT